MCVCVCVSVNVCVCVCVCVCEWGGGGRTQEWPTVGVVRPEAGLWGGGVGGGRKRGCMRSEWGGGRKEKGVHEK